MGRPKRTHIRTSKKGMKFRAGRKKLIFVVHEHHARNLHWDLRLQEGKVLKSWAVPKAPPILPDVRRMAIRVDDHPLSYAKFKGTIPEGQYGAGQVRIWDSGTYDVLDKKPDKYVLDMHGKILRGGYVLINTKMGGNPNIWILFKKVKL